MSSFTDHHHQLWNNFVINWWRIIIVIIGLIEVIILTNAKPQNTILSPKCPPGYQLMGNLCYYQTNYNSLRYNYNCPINYFMAANGYCYPNSLTSTTSTTTTSTSTTTTTTTTTISPLNTSDDEVNNIANSDRCPADSIFLEDKCRKIICSLGEYYGGRCLQPACPPGLVWRAKRCQKPGYIITIVEVDNVLVNTMHEEEFTVAQPNITNMIHHHGLPTTTTTTSTTTTPSTTTTTATNATATITATTPILRINTTSRKPFNNSSLPKNKEQSGKSGKSNRNEIDDEGCCTIVTPRICKDYHDQWICFNRRHKRCDRRICKTTIMYLRAPEIRFKPPMLIMPPFPDNGLNKTNTTSTNTIVNRKETGSHTSGYTDCSGCIDDGHGSEQCDTHCYSYLCPEGICSFLNLKDYCNYYSGQYGCLPEDGCLWSWC